MSQSENDVVVSGRVRLARNYHDLPFSNLSNPENAQLGIDRAREAMDAGKGAFVLHTLEGMPKVGHFPL